MCSIVSIFNNHPTPLLLPARTIKVLIKQNKELFKNTIYLKHEYLIYNYGFIFPVLPMHLETMGYIYRLQLILKPSFTSLYQLTLTGIIIKNNVVQYNMPKHVVCINGTFKKIVVARCIALSMNNYL